MALLEMAFSTSVYHIMQSISSVSSPNSRAQSLIDLLASRIHSAVMAHYNSPMSLTLEQLKEGISGELVSKDLCNQPDLSSMQWLQRIAYGVIGTLKIADREYYVPQVIVRASTWVRGGCPLGDV